MTLELITEASVSSARDELYLKLAIQTAVENVQNSGGPFGAVILTAEGEVFTSGNRVTENNDPTAHAEVETIRKACAALGTFSLAGATLYSSCEPCPMCLGAALWSRVDRIVFAADRHDAAAAGFDDAAFYALLAEGGVAQRLQLETSLAPFQEWESRASRVEY